LRRAALTVIVGLQGRSGNDPNIAEPSLLTGRPFHAGGPQLTPW
jgi:hypothetical protein